MSDNAQKNRKKDVLITFEIELMHYYLQLQHVSEKEEYVQLLDGLHLMLDRDRFRFELEEITKEIVDLAYMTKQAAMGDVLRSNLIDKISRLVQKADELVDKEKGRT